LRSREVGIVTAEIFRVHVDPEKCRGRNRCSAVAAEMFDLDLAKLEP
jgi:hypothetical protein